MLFIVISNSNTIQKYIKNQEKLRDGTSSDEHAGAGADAGGDGSGGRSRGRERYGEVPAGMQRESGDVCGQM